MAKYESFLGHVFSDRYMLVSIIGEGESSVVFGAFDRETGDTVALKMLAPDRHSDPEATRRFLSEVEVLSLFDHPNIVKLLDVSLEGNEKFFVMEYIQGITLKKHIASKGALSKEEILFLSRPILDALAEVHKKGVVHSDIKPQNVVLVGSGEIKLMDFGISRRITTIDLDTDNETEADVTMGTVQYVSPEQAEGKPLNHLSDVYSFGVMLYEMATATLPFTDEDSGRIAAMHVSSDPIPPSLILPSIPGWLDAVILHAMEKDPAARPQSADELLAELENKQIAPTEEPMSDEPKDLKTLVTEGIKTLPGRIHPPSALVGTLCALFVCVVISLSCLSAALARQEAKQTYVRIPDLVGETFLSTTALGLDEDLYRISVEYVSSPQKSGTVLRQSPAPNRRVNRHGKPVTIKLTVALHLLPEQMPDLSCLTREEALLYLSRYDCEVKLLYDSHPYLPEGYVFDQEPRVGETTSKTVTLYISENE